MPPSAEKPGVRLLEASLQTGAATSPTMLSGPIAETPLSPSASDAKRALGGRIDRSARGCRQADIPLGQKAEGAVA